MELLYIIEEYEKDPANRDYDALDNICSKLKFFKKFSRGTRVYLLKLA